MREVIYEDRRGLLRRRLIRDGDGDEMAEFGMPAEVPEVEYDLDWEVIVREINNVLVRNDVRTRIQLQHTHSLDAICNIVKRHVDGMYVLHERDIKQKDK